MNGSGWHLDKRVSVGHIVTTAVVAVSAVLWMARIENRVDLNAQMIAFNTSQIRKTGEDVKAGFVDMKTDLRGLWIEMRRINDKLADKADR